MVRVCGSCRWFVGFKAPWFDLRVTHGLCGRCYRRLMAYSQGYGLGG
jgi:hypothetical protein